MFRLPMISLVAFSVIILSGCLNAEQEITEKEAVDFANQIEESFVKRHATLMNEIFDKEAFRKNILKRNTIISSNQVNTIVDGIKKTGLGTKIMQTMGSTGSFKIVKKYKKENIHHLVFRLFTDNNLNYYDFELVKRAGTIKAADIYVYATGQYFSETMIESMDVFDNLPLVTKKNKKDVGKKIQTIMELARKGESEKAEELYNDMPEDLKKHRILQIVHVQLSAGLSNEKYMDAISQFQELFPNSPNMYLLLVDKCFVMEDYKNALQNVNRLDSIINRDPMLDYYRAIIYQKLGDQPNRKKSLEQLHQSLPDFVDGNLNLISYYLETEDNEKAASLTEKLIRAKKIKATDLEDLFLQYPGYRERIKI